MTVSLDSVRGGPPDGDWLGTPYLRFERHGALGRCIIDRPERRNALTAAMYFGIRYAVNHTDRDRDLAGLLITGTGDVFAPGGDLSRSNEDGWGDLPNLLGMDNSILFCLIMVMASDDRTIYVITEVKVELGYI